MCQCCCYQLLLTSKTGAWWASEKRGPMQPRAQGASRLVEDPIIPLSCQPVGWRPPRTARPSSSPAEMCHLQGPWAPLSSTSPKIFQINPDIFPPGSGGSPGDHTHTSRANQEFVSHSHLFNTHFICQPFCASERKPPHQTRRLYEAEFLPQMYTSIFTAWGFRW